MKVGYLKYLYIFLIIFILSILGTYAFFSWGSESNNTNVSFDVVAKSVYIYYDAGSNITGADLYPTDDKNNGIKKDITFKISDVVNAKPVTFNLYLDLTSVPDELMDKSFKWALYSGSTEVKTGSITDATANCSKNNTNHITLLSGTINSTTEQKYTLYLWIDGNTTNPDTLMNQSFEVNLHAEGTNAILIEGNNSMSLISLERNSGNNVNMTLQSLVYNFDSYAISDDGENEPTNWIDMGCDDNSCDTGIENKYQKTLNNIDLNYANGLSYVWLKNTNGSISKIEIGKNYVITLNNNNATTAGTEYIYGIYKDGFYKDSSYKEKYASNEKIVVPTKINYNFGGYSDIINSEGGFISGSQNKYYDDLTLTATWTTDAYNLTINPNSGTWNSTTSALNIKQDYNTKYTISSLPTKKCYVFAGWTLSGGGSINQFDSSSVETSSVTTNYDSTSSTLPSNYGGSNVSLSMVSDSSTSSGYSMKVTTSGGASASGAGGFIYEFIPEVGGVTVYTVTAKIPVGYNIYLGGIGSIYSGVGSSYKVASGNQAGTGEYKDYVFVIYGGLYGRRWGTGYTYIDGSDNTSVSWNVSKVKLQQYTGKNFKSSYTFGTSDGTLTANWHAGGSGVGFDSNGGTFDTTYVKEWSNGYYSASSSYGYRLYFYGDSYKSAPSSSNYNWTPDSRVISRSGYTFDGWYTSASGGTKVFNSDGTLVPNVSGYSDANSNWIYCDKDVTLYAHWIENVYQLYDSNGNSKGYVSNLSKAVSNVSSGGTIKALKDNSYSSDSVLSVAKPLTINTNGYSINLSVALYINSNPNVIINGGGKISCSKDCIGLYSGILSISNVSMSSTSASSIYMEGGTVNVSSGTLEGTSGIYMNGGTANINGGKIIGNSNVGLYSSNSNVTITDGSIIGKKAGLYTGSGGNVTVRPESAFSSVRIRIESIGSNPAIINNGTIDIGWEGVSDSVQNANISSVVFSASPSSYGIANYGTITHGSGVYTYNGSTASRSYSIYNEGTFNLTGGCFYFNDSNYGSVSTTMQYKSDSTNWAIRTGEWSVKSASENGWSGYSYQFVYDNSTISPKLKTYRVS